MLGGAVQRVVRRPFCVHSKHRVEKKAPASPGAFLKSARLFRRGL